MYNVRVDLRGLIYLAYNGCQYCFVFCFAYSDINSYTERCEKTITHTLRVFCILHVMRKTWYKSL